MATFELSNAAGHGFNIASDEQGFFVVFDDGGSSGDVVYDDGKTVVFDVYGDPRIDSFGVNYATDGYNVVVQDVIYWNDDKEVLSVGGLDLLTTVPDLTEGTAWNVRVNAQSDLFQGNDFSDVIRAGHGHDDVYGNGGNDTLYGEQGSDLLAGGAGNDRLVGGIGADQLIGSAGKDTFVFAALSDSTVAKGGRDTIYDFAKGDRFDLSAIDASTKTRGNQSFSFIGTEKFHGKAGELRYDKAKTDTYVYADTNGDKKADFAFHLDDAVKLAKADFLL